MSDGWPTQLPYHGACSQRRAWTSKTSPHPRSRGRFCSIRTSRTRLSCSMAPWRDPAAASTRAEPSDCGACKARPAGRLGQDSGPLASSNDTCRGRSFDLGLQVALQIWIIEWAVWTSMHVDQQSGMGSGPDTIPTPAHAPPWGCY